MTGVGVACVFTLAAAVGNSSPAYAAGETQLIAYTGAPVAYTVPTGVTAINVVVNGAQGGGGDGGFGAKLTTTLTVTPGQILQVTAGGTGGVGAGGFNGGGAPGAPGSGGVGVNFGGGGASDIRTGACAATLSCGPGSRVIVAGGGGAGAVVVGAWGLPNGGTGGTPNATAGGSSRAGGGGGATQAAPGTGGAPGPGSGTGTPGQAGQTATGGTGGANNIDDPGPAWCAGAGGGGGYYGGGGGGGANGPCETGAGGGGGSSWTDPAGTTATAYTDNRDGGAGAITITPADSGAPSLAAGQVTDLTGATAILHGVVNANGSETTAWFETATDPNFNYLDHTWAATPATINGQADTAVTANISGLDWPGDITYLRLHAQNATGHTYSQPVNFTTPNVPEKPAAPAAWAGDDPTSINISWVAPEDGGTPITGYTITANPGGASCATNATTLACVISGLNPTGTYTFTLTATNPVGVSPASNPSTPTTPTPQPLLLTGDDNQQILLNRPSTVTFTLSGTTITGETINPQLPGTITLTDTRTGQPLCTGTVPAGVGACTLRPHRNGPLPVTATYTGTGAANHATATTPLTLHVAPATIRITRINSRCPARATITGQTTPAHPAITIQQLITNRGRRTWRNLKTIHARDHTYRTNLKTRPRHNLTLRARIGRATTTAVAATTHC